MLPPHPTIKTRTNKTNASDAHFAQRSRRCRRQTSPPAKTSTQMASFCELTGQSSRCRRVIPGEVIERAVVVTVIVTLADVLPAGIVAGLNVTPVRGGFPVAVNVMAPDVGPPDAVRLSAKLAGCPAVTVTEVGGPTTAKSRLVPDKLIECGLPGA